MSSPATNITTITANDAQQALQSDGLDTLGLTTLALSTRWADVTPAGGDYDETALTLDMASLHAPYRGILEFAFSPVTTTLDADITDKATTMSVKPGDGDNFPSPIGGTILLTLTSSSSTNQEVVECSARATDSFTITRGAADSGPQAFKKGDTVSLRLSAGTRTSSFIGADGNPLTGTCAVYRLHPAAILRLETLMSDRYGLPVILPIPWCMVVRGAQGFKSARWFEPDEAIAGISGKISFHDGRGFIVDPVYIAALFSDLQAWLAGLTGKTATAAIGGAGGAQSIAGLKSGTLLHVVDLHGSVYQPALAGATLKTSAGTVTNGLATLSGATDGIDTSGGDSGRLRWGWATNGVLGKTKLVPPALPGGGAPPANLARQFYRVAVVDTVWALLGNRTSAAVLGIPADDQTIPADLLLKVRDQVVITYLSDGPDALGKAAVVLARTAQNMVLAISPTLDGTMAIPATPGLNAHWPAFPAPNSNQTFPNPPASAKDGIQAAWTAGNDVVVTIAADQVPDGAHVRIYPQVFVTIPAITEEPSFVRGDGGASIARAGAQTDIFLPNPFALIGGQPKPSPANLTMDIVVMPRVGTRKMWGAVSVPVAAGPAAVPADPFIGPNPIAAMVPMFESVAPDPLFGIPTTVAPPGAAPGNVIVFCPRPGFRKRPPARPAPSHHGPIRNSHRHRNQRWHTAQHTELGGGAQRRPLGARNAVGLACQRQPRKSCRPRCRRARHPRYRRPGIRSCPPCHAPRSAHRSAARHPRHSARLGHWNGWR